LGLSVAADAAIYNLAELAWQLGCTASTAEVIAAGYAQWGAGVFDRLDGDFAIVIWDSRSGRFYAGRDPFGVRALCYSSDRRRLVVASEAKQIIRGGFASPEPDLMKLAALISDKYSDLEHSFFQGIRRLAPGHLLIADQNGVRTERYWCPPVQPQSHYREPRTSADQFRSLFRSAVAKRVNSPYPIAIELSGGLDSSSIAAVAWDLRDTRGPRSPALAALSYTYAGLECDETNFIGAVLETRPMAWYGLEWRIDGYPELAAEAMWRTDSPFADLQRPMRAEAERVAHELGARVLLSGFGGDEVLYDRGALSDLARSGRLLQLVHGSESWRECISAMLPKSFKEMLRCYRPHQSEPTPAWLSPEAASLVTEPQADDYSTTALQNVLWKWLALDGRVSWATGWYASGTVGVDLEPRFPFLDRELFEFIFSLPLHQRLPRGKSKQLLRDGLALDLPPAILNRTDKANFAQYFTLVLKRAWPELNERLRGADPTAGGLLLERGVEDLTAAWERDPCPAWELTYPLWRIVCVKLWLSSLGQYAEPGARPNSIAATC
jgi:asparagine synthase (glutamine-hydrolysing)